MRISGFGSGAEQTDGSTITENPRGKAEAAPFAITGEQTFAPDIFPSTIRPRRQRNLNRSKNFCKGEDVSDNGAKNWEIHIVGKMIGPEKTNYKALSDVAGVVDLTSPTWSGEVRIKETEYEGPTGWHPPTGYFYYDYTLDVVAVGQTLESEGNGIVSGGDELDINTTGFSGGGDDAFSG